MSKKDKIVKVDTSSRITLYDNGEYPVGYIKLVMEDYINRAEWFDKIVDNMNAKIKALEKENETLNSDSNVCVANKMIIIELKTQLLNVNAWWEPSMETPREGRWYDNTETCQHLRPFGK